MCAGVAQQTHPRGGHSKCGEASTHSKKNDSGKRMYAGEEPESPIRCSSPDLDKKKKKMPGIGTILLEGEEKKDTETAAAPILP